MTRRQPAIAFCASVSTWVPICTGPTNSVTRNANASTSPARDLAVDAEQHADDQHAGVRPGRPRRRRARTRPRSSPCALVLASL